MALVRERALRDEVSFINEAKQEGRQEEAQRILRKQLGLKFGDLPGWVEQRLDQATAEQLDDWSAAVLTANALDELFKH
ncbi:hypothetical protein HORIV_44790 [Vreelandella olivaria]|uniref:DUF4351 domain-containing protein n=1 Tax=Vreelandella olivaria TaxID=390919 RepID=A0ABN5WYJ8_9GAMM|nr:hypothetical protein HORIV_44790 [Halomonas olivaria]